MKRMFLAFVLTAALVSAGLAVELPLEEYFKTYRVGSLSFSPDETQLAFVSDKSGLWQPYIMPVKGGEWKRLVETPDAVSAITWCPVKKDLLFFLMDQGGNENFHIYKTTPAGGTYEDITPWEGKRSAFMGWSKSGKYLYFMSNRRDDHFMDTYRLDVETMQSEVIFENHTTFSVNDISPDDKTLILNEFLNITSSNLYTYDIATKQMEAFTTQEDGEASYVFADFSPDGKLYYVLTDKGSEFTYLTTYNPATKKWKKELESPWDVTNGSFSFQGTYFLTSINEDGISKVEIKNVKTGRPLKLPPLPKAEIIPAQFSRSERYLLIVVNADNIPGDWYLLDLKDNQLTKLTNLFDNSQVKQESLVTSRLIRYKSFDGREIPCWLYLPRTLPEGGKAPIVLDIHGGPTAQQRTGYNGWTQFLLSRGYIVAAPNVRGSTGYGKSYHQLDDQKWGEDPLYDVVYLKKYLGSLPNADTSRTVIWGGSYGGYMVLAALTFTPTEFAMGLDWVGPSNMFTFLNSIPPYWKPYRNFWIKEVGDPENPADSLRFLRQSPLFHADKIQRPLFIVQGKNDPRVNMAESDQIVEAARKNGKEVEYLVFEDEGHGLRKRENRIKAFGAMYAFMEKHLK